MMKMYIHVVILFEIKIRKKHTQNMTTGPEGINESQYEAGFVTMVTYTRTLCFTDISLTSNHLLFSDPFSILELRNL